MPVVVCSALLLSHPNPAFIPDPTDCRFALKSLPYTSSRPDERELESTPVWNGSLGYGEEQLTCKPVHLDQFSIRKGSS